MRSILSAVDFSEPSRHALRWAGAFAERFDARLTVLSVVDPLLADAARIRLAQDLAKAETEPALRQFIAATWPDEARSARVQVQVQTGDAAEVILHTACREAVELIVLGTQGLGGFRKWLLGSTTERVLRGTRVPVLAVPPRTDSPDLQGTAEGPFGLVRLLAATDFSASSLAAVESAARLAREFSAALSVVHVVEPSSVPPQWRALAEEAVEARVAEARARLEGLVDQLCGSPGCDAIVSVGRAADVIASIAEENRAQLIVMGLNGDQGRSSPRPGSIAYRVLCSTMVPVLVVPLSSSVSD